MSIISVILPTCNAEDYLVRTLSSLIPGVVEGLIKEVIIVDTGSTDATLEIADSTGCRIIHADPQRGLQLWQGCREATGDWLLILHPDSELSPQWLGAVRQHMKHHDKQAGYFHINFDQPSLLSRLWSEMIAFRAKWLSMPGSDNGLLLSRPLYDAVGGYKDQVAFEDVTLVLTLGKARLRPLGVALTTGFDRFHQRGWLVRAVWRWISFVLYLLGVPPKPSARK